MRAPHQLLPEVLDAAEVTNQLYGRMAGTSGDGPAVAVVVYGPANEAAWTARAACAGDDPRLWDGDDPADTVCTSRCITSLTMAVHRACSAA